MAQNITLMGASYSSVPAVTLPKTGGGTASFTDVTDTTAAASDVATGKYFYTAAGVRTQGTGSGGGGGSVTQDANGYIVLPSTGGGGGGGATPHTIHLEFSDSTDTDIDVYYDDSLLGTMITNYAPSTWTYSNKTVMLAELDGTAWYDKTTIPIGVELVDFTKLTNDTAVGNDGEIVYEQWYCTTDYMPIQPEMTFTFSCLIWSRIGFFDSNYESVGVAEPYGSNWATQRQNETNYCDGTLTGSTIPSNAAFVVLVSTNNASSNYLSFIRTA